MTISIAWVRKGADGEELWMASDSRLGGDGYIWDDCPKLLILPRRDAIVGFTGSTAQAYPLMLQLVNSIASYGSAANGNLEFNYLVAHLERVVNAMLKRLRPDPGIIGPTAGDTVFATGSDALILGGYSWTQGRMVIRGLRYHSAEKAWKFSHVRPLPKLGGGRLILVTGDYTSRGRYRYLLSSLLSERGILNRRMAFNFEPLETLASMLAMPASIVRPLALDCRPRTIGGAPQVIRSVPGGDATSYAVRWPTDTGNAIYLQGRPIFDYERLDSPLVSFEGSTPTIHAPRQWPHNA
jgi:hypothetical protein